MNKTLMWCVNMFGPGFTAMQWNNLHHRIIKKKIDKIWEISICSSDSKTITNLNYHFQLFWNFLVNQVVSQSKRHLNSSHDKFIGRVTRKPHSVTVPSRFEIATKLYKFRDSNICFRASTKTIIAHRSFYLRYRTSSFIFLSTRPVIAIASQYVTNPKLYFVVSRAYHFQPRVFFYER